MYPAQALVDGDYTVDDLPDVFIEYAPAGSITYTKLNPPISELGGLWYYEATISGVVERLGIALNPGLWTYQGQGESGPCLITTFGQQAPGREDQFADTYTVTWNYAGSDVPPANSTVSRVSLCVWEGVDPCGVPIYLFYDNNMDLGGGEDYKWNLKLNNYVGGCGGPDFIGYIINKDSRPPSYQNTPIGYYLETYATDATVS